MLALYNDGEANNRYRLYSAHGSGHISRVRCLIGTNNYIWRCGNGAPSPPFMSHTGVSCVCHLRVPSVCVQYLHVLFTYIVPMHAIPLSFIVLFESQYIHFLIIAGFEVSRKILVVLFLKYTYVLFVYIKITKQLLFPVIDDLKKIYIYNLDNLLVCFNIDNIFQ